MKVQYVFIPGLIVALLVASAPPALALEVYTGNEPALGGARATLSQAWNISDYDAGKVLSQASQVADMERIDRFNKVVPAKDVPMLRMTPTGWKGLVPANSTLLAAGQRLPLVGQLIGLALQAGAVAAAVAKAIYGDGTGSSPLSNARWRFSYEDNGRYIWMTRQWQGPTTFQMHSSYPGTSTTWFGELWLGYDMLFNDPGSELSGATARVGEAQSIIQPGSAGGLATAVDDGVTLSKYLLPTGAAKLYQLGKNTATNTNMYAWKLGETQLPVFYTLSSNPTQHHTQQEDTLENATPEQLAEVLKPGTQLGHYAPIDPASIPIGTTVVKEQPDGTSIKEPWDGPAEGTGVKAEPTPMPSPTPTPVPDPTPTPVPTPQTSPTPYANDVTLPKTPQGQAPNFVTHFFDRVGTKFPFDMFSGIDLTGDQHPLCYKSFVGVKTEAKLVKNEAGQWTHTWGEGQLAEREHCWMDVLRLPLNIIVWCGYVGLVIFAVVNI